MTELEGIQKSLNKLKVRYPKYIPLGKVETIEEFIARGGKVTKCEPGDSGEGQYE